MKNYQKAFCLLLAFVLMFGVAGVWGTAEVYASSPLARNVSQVNAQGVEFNAGRASRRAFTTGSHVSGHHGTTVGAQISNITVSTNPPLATSFIWSGSTTVRTGWALNQPDHANAFWTWHFATPGQ